jgi:hypothetical protein
MDSGLAKAVRAAAAYDLVTCLPMAVPGLAWHYLSFLAWAGGAVGLHGAPLGAVSPTGMMLVNFLGASMTVWAALRLVRPERVYAVADCANRVFFLLAMAYAFAAGVPGILWVVAAAELGLLALQAWAFRPNQNL